jgi:hypothetical protein
MTKAPKTPEITIATMPGGAAVVNIAGTTYLATPSRKGFTFQKQSEKGGQCYEVLVGGGKARSCSCPAAGWGYSACRHATAADKILAAW